MPTTSPWAWRWRCRWPGISAWPTGARSCKWICRGYLPVGLMGVGLTGSRGGMIVAIVGLLFVPLSHDQAHARPPGHGHRHAGTRGLPRGGLRPGHGSSSGSRPPATKCRTSGVGGRFKLWVGGMKAFSLQPLMGLRHRRLQGGDRSQPRRRDARWPTTPTSRCWWRRAWSASCASPRCCCLGAPRRAASCLGSSGASRWCSSGALRSRCSADLGGLASRSGSCSRSLVGLARAGQGYLRGGATPAGAGRRLLRRPPSGGGAPATAGRRGRRRGPRMTPTGERRHDRLQRRRPTSTGPSPGSWRRRSTTSSSSSSTTARPTAASRGCARSPAAIRGCACSRRAGSARPRRTTSAWRRPGASTSRARTSMTAAIPTACGCRWPCWMPSRRWDRGRGLRPGGRAPGRALRAHAADRARGASSRRWRATSRSRTRWRPSAGGPGPRRAATRRPTT